MARKLQRFVPASGMSASDLGQNEYDSFVNNFRVIGGKKSKFFIESQRHRGQTNNASWKEFRKGMVTVSNFRRVCAAIDGNKIPLSLIKTVMGQYSEPSVAANKDKYIRM